jgi:sugar diacid utilization regulator/GAF domain-containing protein
MVNSGSTRREQLGMVDEHSIVAVLELLNLAEHGLSLEETVAQLLMEISRGLAVNDSLAIVFAPTFTVHNQLPGSNALIDEVMLWSRTALTNAVSAVLVERGNIRPLVEWRQRLSVIQHMTTFNCWSVLESDSQMVLILLRIPSNDPGRLNVSQAALRALTTELLKRREAAQDARIRPQRSKTLYQMVEAIASSLDTDQVLGAIVERARNLLHADSAYLSEVNETTKRLTMRATSGIEDEGYKRSTSQLGETIFGAVAASRKIIFTDDYVTDTRFTHTPATDANVSREGLKGIIAAPLQVGDRVLGVLGIANRGPIDTSPERLELVRGLAHGAAIALENARLHVEQLRLVEQLQILNELTSTQHEALKRSVAIQNQLTELVLQGHNLEVIAHRLSDLLGAPILVLGPFFNILARTGLETGQAKAVASAVASARVTPRFVGNWTQMMTTYKPIRLLQGANFVASPAQVVTPIVVGDDVVGYVVVVEMEAVLDDMEFIALQQAATVFAVELTRTRVIAEVEHRLRADFVNDLVSKRFDPQMVFGRAKGIGHDLSVPQVLLAFASNPVSSGSSISASNPRSARVIDDDRRLERAVRVSLQRRELMAQISMIGEVTVVLVALPGSAGPPRDKAITIARGLYGDLASTLKPMTVAIGMSCICYSMDAIAESYREALIAMKKGQQFDLGNSLTIFDELGVDRVLSMASDQRGLEEYVESQLGALLDYDRERGACLVLTLEAYINSGGRLRETARAVGIHVNSLDYRLRRIEQISSVSLNDADSRLDLAMALRARRLILLTNPNCRFESH